MAASYIRCAPVRTSIRNPLENLESMTTISLRVKGGRELPFAR